MGGGAETPDNACANMVLMGVSSFPENVEEERDVIVETSRKHTASLDVENLEAIVEETLLLADNVTDTYEAWHDTVVQPRHVEDLLDRVEKSYISEDDAPEWVSDALASLEDAAENGSLDKNEDDTLTSERRQSIIEAHTPGDVTVWDAYNDLTENIWHDDGTGDRTKRRKFQQVHRTFPVSDHLK